MNKKTIFILSISLLSIANLAFGAVCDKNNVCDLNKGENYKNCSDCYDYIYPEIKFKKADITAYSGKIVNMNDFAEASIKFSVKAVNGNIYVPADMEFCSATSSQIVPALLAQTSFDPKRNIYLIKNNQTIDFECRLLIMPESTGPYIGFLKQFVWGKSAKTAKQNVWDLKNKPEFKGFSTFPIVLKSGDIKMMIPGLHIVALSQRTDELKKELAKEMSSPSKKNANKLKLEIKYLETAIEKFKPKSN